MDPANPANLANPANPDNPRWLNHLYNERQSPDPEVVAAVGVPTLPTTVLRFGPFDLDSRSGELRKGGDVVKLPPQPFKVLTLLARRSGEVVTRNEIQEQIWHDETFVDFDQGLNFCIRQIREALGDDADAQRYIETLPRRGYRFLMPV